MNRSNIVPLRLLWLAPFLAFWIGAPAMAEIDQPELDQARAFSVAEATLPIALGGLSFDRGFGAELTDPSGHRLGQLIIGEGRLRITPENDVERRQLRLFSSRDSIDAHVTAAALLSRTPNIGDGEAAADSLSALQSQREELAESSFWRLAEVEEIVVRARLQDPEWSDAQAFWIRTVEFGDLVWLHLPGQDIGTRLIAFVPDPVDESSERQRLFDRYEFGGIRGSVDGKGQWDTWVATLSSQQPQPESVSASHFNINSTVNPESDDPTRQLVATAGIDLKVEAERVSIVRLQIGQELSIDGITVNGAERPFHKAGETSYLVELGEPRAQGERLHLNVQFHGTLFYKLTKGNYVQTSPSSWYPTISRADWATFELNFDFPKSLQLVGSGKVVSDQLDGRRRLQQRRVDFPTYRASFEIGLYKVQELDVNGTQVTIAISKLTRGSIYKGYDELLRTTIRDSLLFFEEKFGPYPADYLTVATVPERPYSQAFHGFVTLRHSTIGGVHRSGGERWRPDREFNGLVETLAHEISHQWWGLRLSSTHNQDIWLYEALAQYSEILYAAPRATYPGSYYRNYAASNRTILRYTDGRDRPVENLGPVTLGHRLNSSLNDRARRLIVYTKGGGIMRMLAAKFGEERFARKLKALVAEQPYRTITTQEFIEAMERLGGHELDEFANKYIYGVGLPSLSYEFTIAQVEAGWEVRGHITQLAPRRNRLSVKKVDERWNFVSEPADDVFDSTQNIVAPIQIVLKASVADGRRRTLETSLTLDRDRTEFVVPVPEEPIDLILDPRGHLVAQLISPTREPRRSMMRQAERARLDNWFDSAEELYLAALDEPVFSAAAGAGRATWELENFETETSLEIVGGLITLALARSDAAKATELAKSVDLATSQRFRGHLAVIEGRYRDAFNNFRDSVRLIFPRRSTDVAADSSRRKRFLRGTPGSGRDYALLAIAAHFHGKPIVAARAIEEAEFLGVDMSELRQEIGTTH